MEIAIIPAPDLLSRLRQRILDQFTASAEEWSSMVSGVSRWEEQHLLDNPTPEALADHAKTLEHLLEVGGLIQRVSTHPDFPNRRTTEMVNATLEVLNDKLHMWHGPQMSKVESDRILAACFPDEH